MFFVMSKRVANFTDGAPNLEPLSPCSPNWLRHWLHLPSQNYTFLFSYKCALKHRQ